MNCFVPFFLSLQFGRGIDAAVPAVRQRGPHRRVGRADAVAGHRDDGRRGRRDAERGGVVGRRLAAARGHRFVFHVDDGDGDDVDDDGVDVDDDDADDRLGCGDSDVCVSISQKCGAFHGVDAAPASPVWICWSR